MGRLSLDPSSPPHALGSPAILVVDDEPGFTDTLVDILGAKGYTALTATTGREGEKIARQRQVDLALVDLKLPDQPGIDVLARIKSRTPETEVIVLTGHASLDTALRALNLGAFAYLEKPYDVDRLFLLIERALSLRSRKKPTDAVNELTVQLDRFALGAFAFDTKEGRVSSTNRAFDRLLGIEDSAAAVESLQDIIAGAGPDAAGDLLARLRKDGTAALDFILRLSPGRTIVCELTSALSDENPGQALGLLRNVTVRRRAEIESRRTRQYFEAILNNLPAGVAIIDSRFTIQMVNPEFARFHRGTTAEIIGRKCHEVIHLYQTPCQLHGEVCPIINCLASGTTTRVQHRHLGAEDGLRYQECTMTPLRDESGTVISFVAMYMDFTKIKQAQEESDAKSRQLETLNLELAGQGRKLSVQAEELSRANAELVRLAAAKDDFVSVVSHELRTPLTAISEGINLVADGSLGGTTDGQRRFLDLARRNCARLTELIDDLLDLSKIEAGRMDVRRSRTDLAQMLTETRDVFAAAARDKGLSIDAFGVESPVFVHADERMIRRVLSNLVSNAVKFTDRGSIRLTLHSGIDQVRIEVADTGIGIPASEHARIFEKFHQVCQGTRPRPPGTGLGLALSRQMIEMNSGRISFESNEGRGSTFRFTLPLDRGPLDTSTSPQLADEDLSPVSRDAP